MPRTAVVLFNLGGPDSPEAIRPFLYNLFSDPDLLRVPLGWLLQRPLAWLIARRRAPSAARNYAVLGGRSPLLENTLAQARALETALRADGDYAVEVCMRYWHPFTREVVARLRQGGIGRVLLLPLYPQYSGTTTGSSVNEFRRECRRQGYSPELKLVRHWYDQPDFLAGIVETLRAEATRFPDPDPARIELLCSAHGLPRKLVDAGDPYADHVRATFEAVRRDLGWPHATLCFQSRVGPLEWLRPYTDDVIRDKAAAGARQLLVYPIAFVSDHVETLVELGREYAELAHAAGIPLYRVAPALNDHPRLVTALRALVREAETDGSGRVEVPS